jgi:multimeric flavodoxin WrbA
MTSSPPEFSDLRAVFINCTLKKSPELSHTQGLMDRSIALMRRLGVTVDTLRLIDHPVATGVYPDMREHGWAEDAWPEEIWPRILDADVLVIGGPLWLGDNSALRHERPVQ